jgi:hypothetical protein
MDTREFNKLYNNIRNPYEEEDNQSIEFGQNIKTIPTGFSFDMNRPSLYQEEQSPVSGGIKDLRNYVNSTMGNINPQLGYTDPNYGANISMMMNPLMNAPKSYSAGAYYGPEQDRYNLGITTIPTAGAKQLSAGYEGPYGNISLGASRDPMGRNYTANYNYRFADGGLAPITVGMPIAPGYAHGGYISQGEPVQTHLTTTIPPVRGPMSQGVETLFKKRYS